MRSARFGLLMTALAVLVVLATLGGVSGGRWRCCSGTRDIEIPQPGDQRTSAGEDNAVLVFYRHGTCIE